MSYMKRHLQELRERMERETGETIAAIDVESAALMLADVCDALELEAQEQLEVLGEAGAQYVAGWLSTPVALNGAGAQLAEAERPERA